MKLLRYGPVGQEKPGLFLDGSIRDLSGQIDDICGDTLDDETIARIASLDPADLPVVEEPVRLGACVGKVGKFVCIGLNYADHAAESGMDLPQEPVIFFKATSAIIGPNDTVHIPRNSVKTDWEVELGVVLGALDGFVEGFAGLWREAVEAADGVEADTLRVEFLFLALEELL